ncbi:MAG TPA: transglycosylase domain-containing protein [Acidimicrobiales bacterium]|jgi:penicillin-binding protein 1A|nr:transglycosylase domain-containing protein [Acidimicrobiales bacterium]
MARQSPTVPRDPTERQPRPSPSRAPADRRTAAPANGHRTAAPANGHRTAAPATARRTAEPANRRRTTEPANAPRPTPSATDLHRTPPSSRRPAPRNKQGPAKAGAPPGPKPERRSWLWRHRRILFLVWLFVFFGIGGALYLLSRVPLPAVQPQTQTSFIYAANGTQLAAINTGQNRVAVSLNQVPQVAIDAVVATEDHNYYQHGGVDLVGVLRALASDLRGQGNLQGGSTITQQYVKQAYLNSQRTLLRKIKEAALAVRLQRTLTKNQILERYLNTIYWGRGAYGIQAASQAYFQENVQQLTLPQAALLAGLIRGPELADPVNYPSVAMGRRAESLASMVRYHKITQAQADQANGAPLPTTPVNALQQAAAAVNDAHHDQYYLDYVEQQVQQRYPLALGLRITTTIDLGMQDQAYQAMYGSAGLNYKGDPAGALVAVDDNGDVRAMVGGKDYSTSQVNLAVGTAGGGSGRQAGSTFKPFLLAETLKEGYSVNSTFPGPPTVNIIGQGNNGTDYPVNNFNNEDAGPAVSLINATAQSVNTVYAQLEMAIGPAKLLAMAESMGLSASDVGMKTNASLVLGTAQVSVLEMAAAYSTFARGGVYLAPQVITKITTANGTVLPWPSAAPKTILTPAQNQVLEYVLQQVVQKGGTAPGANFGTPIAGKTGTTSDYTDAWFDGFTPKLTAAVWIGYPSNSKPMVGILGSSGGVEGGGEPATLWRHFMQAVTQNGTNQQYTGAFVMPTPKQLGGALIGPPSSLVSYPKGLGTATTTTLPTTASTSLPRVTTRPTTTTPVGHTTPTQAPPPVTDTTVPVTPTTRPTHTTTPTTTTGKSGH